MDEINWKVVSDKIRTKKFSEIADNAWSQIADKIEPKKRGRKPKTAIEYRDDWSLEDIHETDKKYLAIVLKYDRLRMKKIRSKKAFELIAKNLDSDGKPDTDESIGCMSVDNVERIVYAWIKMEKELQNLMLEECA